MSDIRYLTDHFDQKIARIKEIGAPLNFVFITDEHNRLNEHAQMRNDPGKPVCAESALNAVESIRYLLERCPEISFAVSGGDMGDDYSFGETMRASHIELMDALYSLPVPVHCCIGNHDDGLGNAVANHWDVKNQVLLPDELHAICMKYNPTKENYYYFDDETNHFRFIFLNTSDLPYCTDENGQYPFGWRYEISEKQAVWLEEDALKTDKRVFVFSHTPLHNAGIFGSGSTRQPLKPYDDLLNGPRVYYAIKQSPVVAASIFGHVHYDNFLYDGDLLVMSTTCSMMQKWCASCPDRVPGTVSETAFDVISVKDDMLYATRFGAGADRMGRLFR